MEIKTGIDLVLDNKFDDKLENKDFLKTIFHPSELKILNSKKLAGIFALKECVFKALNIASTNWLEIEVTYEKKGKPLVNLSPKIYNKNITSIDSSISHENGSTIGIVIILLDNK